MAKNKRGGRLDPDDVLEGRARPNARELIALIHDVNPSGHDLPAREAARRYAQKSRLQSLLIHRHADELLVEPTDAEGVIGLRHRTSGADACHAVLASLDDDARSWAQRQIDLGADENEGAPLARADDEEDEEPPPDAPLEDLSTDEILRRGKAALKEYDFEAARACFTAAFDRGRMEAGVLLLTVLAEHLALDAEALELEERLDHDTLEEPEVRLLLAQAAARLDDRSRAVRLVRADAGDAAAEVFVALAKGALARDDLALAASDVGEIQRRGPTHPALLGLADTVKKRRAEARAPEEAEVQRLFDEGRFEDAEAKAELVAARWPESTVASAILRAAAERRRVHEGRALAAEGRAALAAGEGARAVGLLRRSLPLLKGDLLAEVQADLAKAEALDREQAEAARATAVAQLLEAGHTLRGLTEYVALDDERRGLVKARTNLEELVLVDQTLVRGVGPDAKAAAQAVMALRRAIAVSATDPTAAFDLIAAHWNVLHRVELAAQLAALVHESHRLRVMTEAIQRFTAGMSAFDGTREGLTRALKILATVKRAELDDPEEYDRVVGRLRRAEERMERALEVGKLRTSGDLVGAKKALEALIRFEEAGAEVDAEDVGRVDWTKKRDEVIRDMERLCDLRVSGGPSGDLLGQEARPLFDVPTALLPGHAEMILGEAHLGLIFLQAVDVASGRVTRRATIRMKSPLVVSRLQQNGGNVVLLGSDATCIEVAPQSWQIVRAVSLGEGEGPLHQSVLAPGGRFLWNADLRDGWWIAFTVEDNERSAYVKNYSEACRRIGVRPLLGAPEPRVVVIRDRGSVTVYESRGAPVGTTHERLPALRNGVVVHPSGKGLFALLREGEWGTFEVTWAELLPDGTPIAAGTASRDDRRIPELDSEARCDTAVSLDARMVYVLGARKRTGTKCLLGFAARDGRVERCFDVEVPARVTLAQDEAARTVVAVSPHEEGIEVVPLGASAPVFAKTPPEAAPLCRRALTLLPLEPCAPPDMRVWSMDGDNGPGGFLGIELMRTMEADARGRMIDGVLAPEDRPAIVPRYAALRKVPLPAFRDELEAAALARYADDPEMQQIPAHRMALAGDWAGVIERLASIDPDALGDAAAQHHDHLLGAALLMTGDVEGARRAVARGAAREGGACDLSTLLALLDLDLPTPARRASYAGVRELVRAVRGADARLEARDFAGARRALGGLVVREAAEVQTLARRCRAWLSEPDETEPGGDRFDGFARRLALASFLSAHAEKALDRRRELPFPGARWDAAALDALAAEAQAWLDGDQKRPRPGATVKEKETAPASPSSG